MRAYTTTEKISALTSCLKWFVGILILNILTFWVPFLWASANPAAANNFAAWIIVIGFVLMGALTIFFINRLSRVIKSSDVWLYCLPVLIPFTAPVALLLLCRRIVVASSVIGHRIALVPPRVRAGFGSAMIVILGVVIICAQCSEIRNHARLKKAGQQITGTLQMVTRHYVYFIPSGYSFMVAYAGRLQDFTVDKQLFLENTLPDGKFSQHPIAVIYLPDDPGVAELPEMLKGSAFSPIDFLIGGLFVCVGGWGFYLVIANKPWFAGKSSGLARQPQKETRVPVRAFTFDENGQRK
ncbi:MAG TPA: hypothetical protein VMA35_10225 [Candidatus Sulfopaludibacter sp.]|nr:hypothetical protein [Candidatus Sulfopaludibacter sp.]